MRYEGHNTSIATLTQMGTALARLSDAALEIKQNRIADHESCGFAFPNASADALAYGAERKRRELQKARDRASIARQTATSVSWPLERVSGVPPLHFPVNQMAEVEE